MLTRLEMVGSVLHVHADDSSLKTTKTFTHGGITFDPQTGFATFGKDALMKMPAGLVLEEGATVSLQLVAPDGTLKKQTRAIVLHQAKDSHIFRAPGQSKTPAKFSREDGWTVDVRKIRAYFNHPGLKTDGPPPQWLQDSITRQKALWNRLAWLCRDARRKATPVDPEEISKFVNETILPKIDTLNDSLGRSKQKLKHPAKLKVDMPGIDGLWNFVGILRKRVENSLPVPEELLDITIAFAEQYKPDYTEINEFQKNVQSIGESAAAELNLRPYETRAVLGRFIAVLKNRKTRKEAWSDGWPMIRYGDDPRKEDWSLQYYFNKAGVKSEGLETDKGVPGLVFGKPRNPSETGHPSLSGRAAQYLLREATIHVPAGSRNVDWSYTFGILQHRPLPANSHIKQWELVYTEGKLWLCLTVEHQLPVAKPGELTAALDIGWRRVKDGLRMDGIRIGVLYEPVTKTFREIDVNLAKSPDDPTHRTPFEVALGPTRKEKRHITAFLPDWKPGDPTPGTFELRSILNSRRSYLKDTVKVNLSKALGDEVPGWFKKAGKHGILALREVFPGNTAVKEFVNAYEKDLKALDNLGHTGMPEQYRNTKEYMASVTRRLKYAYEQVAHDVCRHLQSKKISHLVIEANFLAKLAQKSEPPQTEGAERYALMNSQKYRQLVAVGNFVAILRKTAPKYAIAVSENAAKNTTRICAHCEHLNPPTAKQSFQCEGCNRTIEQDQNAAVNLSRFVLNPELQQKRDDVQV